MFGGSVVAKLPGGAAAGAFGAAPAKTPSTPPAAGVFGGAKSISTPPPGSVFATSPAATAPAGLKPAPPAAGAFGAAPRPAAPAAGAFGAFGAPKPKPPAAAPTPAPAPAAPVAPAPVATPAPAPAAARADETQPFEIAPAAPPPPRPPSAAAPRPTPGTPPVVPKPRPPSVQNLPAVPRPPSAPSAARPGSTPGVARPPSPPTPAAAARPPAQPPQNVQTAIEFPADAAPRPAEPSELSLLPLEFEPPSVPPPAARPAPAAPPAMKAQIGSTAPRPSVLGTSKLSPTAKGPARSISPGASGLAKPEPKTAIGKSVAPSTLSASLNQRTGNSVVGPLPTKSTLGAPLRPGAPPLAAPGTSGRGTPAAPATSAYARTGNSVVGPLPRPPLSGIATGAAPAPSAGVKMAPTTAVGTASSTSSTPSDVASLEAFEDRASNVPSSLPSGANVSPRKQTMVGLAQTPYAHGVPAEPTKPAAAVPRSFADDFDDQPTLLGDSLRPEPFVSGERVEQPEIPAGPPPVVPPPTTEFVPEPRIRQSALGLLVPADMVKPLPTPAKAEDRDNFDLSDDLDIQPAGSLPPLALPPTSPQMVVPASLQDEPAIPPPPAMPKIPPAPAVPAITPMESVPRSPATVGTFPPADSSLGVNPISGESTLIVRGRIPEIEQAAAATPAPRPRYGLWAAAVIGILGAGTLGALVVTGTIQLPGVAVVAPASTTGVPTATPPRTTGTTTTATPPTPPPTPVAAATVDAGAVAVADAGVAAVAEVDAGTQAVAPPPVEPTPVAPTPVAVPSDLSGVTPDSELPSSNPRASDILVGDAMDLMEAGRLDAAGVALQRAMERDRINPQGFEAYAKYHIARRDFAAAIEAANHAVELRPNDSRYLVVLGDAQLGAGNRSAAQETWRRAVQMDRNRDARARLEANP